MTAPDEGMTPTFGMPIIRRRFVFRRELLYQEDVRHVGMQAPDKIQGKREDLATASGMTAKKKRY